MVKAQIITNTSGTLIAGPGEVFVAHTPSSDGVITTVFNHGTTTCTCPKHRHAGVCAHVAQMVRAMQMRAEVAA